MIHPDIVELIIDKARIDEVIGDFISLKKSGSNYKGCCPFHDEKSPSFMVSPSKGIFKCFGCGKGGNSVSFVMEHERIAYVDALKYLAKKYHIEVIETEVSEEDKQKKDVRESLQVINNYAVDFFVNKLHNTIDGKAIGLSYFKERGFNEHTIKKFQLGYSPEQKDSFTLEALKLGYKLEYLEKTGLSVVGEDYQVDRFRGRVMFPIHSLTGNAIGFGGRIMKADPEKKLAKYLNSPESEIYNKSKTLYGIYFARTTITKKDECILVEGYTDVISMHQSGIENVVASSGTSLTVEQIQLIKRFTTNILVIYDGDSAGIKASFRGIDMILEQGMNVKVLLLPDGDDPDSFAKKHNSHELQEFIEANKSDFITFKTKLFAKETKNDPIQRAKLITDIVNSIAIMPDRITQSVYVSECSKILKIDERLLLEKIQSITIQKHAKDNNYEPPKPQQHKILPTIVEANKSLAEISFSNEKEIIRLLILYGLENITLPHNLLQSSVKDFLYREIVEGDMLLLHQQTKQVFDEYFTQIQEKSTEIVKYLLHHSSKETTNLLVDILAEDKKLSIIWKKESFVDTELHKLPYLVLDTISLYKRRRLEDEEIVYLQMLKNVQDANELTEITKKLMTLKQNIKNIANELNHVS